jgi:hypothetical protein
MRYISKNIEKQPKQKNIKWQGAFTSKFLTGPEREKGLGDHKQLT